MWINKFGSTMQRWSTSLLLIQIIFPMIDPSIVGGPTNYIPNCCWLYMWFVDPPGWLLGDASIPSWLPLVAHRVHWGCNPGADHMSCLGSIGCDSLFRDFRPFIFGMDDMDPQPSHINHWIIELCLLTIQWFNLTSFDHCDVFISLPWGDIGDSVDEVGATEHCWLQQPIIVVSCHAL